MGISKARSAGKVGTAVDQRHMQALQPRHAYQRLRIMTAAKDHQTTCRPQGLNQHVQRLAVSQLESMQTGAPCMARLLQHRLQLSLHRGRQTAAQGAAFLQQQALPEPLRLHRIDHGGQHLGRRQVATGIQQQLTGRRVHALEQQVDGTVATQTKAHCRVAVLGILGRAVAAQRRTTFGQPPGGTRHLALQTATTDSAGGLPKRVDQHPCTGAAIG